MQVERKDVKVLLKIVAKEVRALPPVCLSVLFPTGCDLLITRTWPELNSACQATRSSVPALAELLRSTFAEAGCNCLVGNVQPQAAAGEAQTVH